MRTPVQFGVADLVNITFLSDSKFAFFFLPPAPSPLYAYEGRCSSSSSGFPPWPFEEFFGRTFDLVVRGSGSAVKQFGQRPKFLTLSATMWLVARCGCQETAASVVLAFGLNAVPSRLVQRSRH